MRSLGAEFDGTSFPKNVDRQVYLSVASNRLFFFKFYMMFYNWPKGRREGNPKFSNTIYSAPASIESSIVYAVWPGDEGMVSSLIIAVASSWVEMYVRWRRREKPIKGLINTHGSLVEHRVTGRPIYMVVRSAYSAAQLWQSCRAANR